VLVQGVELGDFVVAGGEVGGVVVLGAVDDSGLEGAVDFAVGIGVATAPKAFTRLTIRSLSWTRIFIPSRSSGFWTAFLVL
jgi:hypothetical protein